MDGIASAYCRRAGLVHSRETRKTMMNNTLLAILALCASPALAQDVIPTPENVAVEKKPYSPYAGRAFPTRVFWGDTHLHTSNSLDARAVGCTLGPEEAFRFARGDGRLEVRLPGGGASGPKLSVLSHPGGAPSSFLAVSAGVFILDPAPMGDYQLDLPG